MQRKMSTLWITAAILGVVILAGVAGVSLRADAPSSHYPNDRANHHPVRPAN